MKLLYVYKIAFALVFLIISCKGQEKDALDDYIKKINKFPIEETSYIFEVDSNKRIIDTLVLRKLKYDTDDNLIFEKKLQLRNHLLTVNYYDGKNGLIYSRVTKNDELISEYRANLKNKLIDSANQSMFYNGKKETVLMKFHYSFENGKKTELLIDLEDNYLTKEFYNEHEKPVLNLLMYKNDTLEKTEFIYDDQNLLKKKKFNNISKNEEIIYKYHQGFIVKESFYINAVEKSYTDYYRDQHGNYLSYTKNLFD